MRCPPRGGGVNRWRRAVHLRGPRRPRESIGSASGGPRHRPARSGGHPAGAVGPDVCDAVGGAQVWRGLCADRSVFPPGADRVHCRGCGAELAGHHDRICQGHGDAGLPRVARRCGRRNHRPAIPGAARAVGQGRCPVLHHLHLRFDGASQGRGDQPVEHLQLHLGLHADLRRHRPGSCVPGHDHRL